MSSIPAFTVMYKNITKQLICKADIIANGKSFHADVALWDTGAVSTCISQRVIAQLGLIPSTSKTAYTPLGENEVEIFTVDIRLYDKITITNLLVAGGDIGDQGIDVLIGMDVISLGDFAVSNYNGTTSFSFRIPSQGQIDFVSVVNQESL